jgi:hypothetical protein
MLECPDTMPTIGRPAAEERLATRQIAVNTVSGWREAQYSRRGGSAQGSRGFAAWALPADDDARGRAAHHRERRSQR